MAALLPVGQREQTRALQPAQPVEMNWQHPGCDKIACAFLPIMSPLGYDCVQHSKGAMHYGSETYEMRKGRFGNYFWTNTAPEDLRTPLQARQLTELTMTSVVSISANPSVDTVVFTGYAPGGALTMTIKTDGTVKVGIHDYAGGNVMKYFTTTPTIPVGKLVVITATVTVSKTLSVFFNGLLVFSQASAVSSFLYGEAPMTGPGPRGYNDAVYNGSTVEVYGVLANFAALPDKVVEGIGNAPWQLFAPIQSPRLISLPIGPAASGLTAAISEAMAAADSASVLVAFAVANTEALALADTASNVASLSAAISQALTLADSASNVAALSATATDALTLADTLNATASGDYTATGSDALTLADSASNVAALGATGSDALTLADAASNVAALGATASDALTLADTLNASASGDYVVVATDALSLSDSVVAAYAAICIATDALTLADATSAAMAGEYAATATDALTLADATSNAAALGVSISEALTLAALVSAMLTGNTALTGKRGGYGVQMQLSARRAQIQTGRRRN